MSDLLPLFPLSTVLFPGMRLPLHIFEERYRKLAADLLAGPEPRRFGVIAIRSGREVGTDQVAAVYEIGCVATVRDITEHPDGRFDLRAVGTNRFRLVRLVQDAAAPYFQGEIELLPDDAGAPGAGTAGTDAAGTDTAEAADGTGAAGAVSQVQTGFRGYLNALADQGGGVISIADLPGEPVLLSYVVAAAMIIDLPERQSLLAAPDAVRRLQRERSLLARETAILRATTSRPAPDYAHEQFSPN